MATDPERLKRTQFAASFCLFDKLRSSGNSSIICGVLNVVIGGAILSANDSWELVSLLLGLGLIAAGIYERRARDSGVVIISAGTLAALGIEFRFDRSGSDGPSAIGLRRND